MDSKSRTRKPPIGTASSPASTLLKLRVPDQDKEEEGRCESQRAWDDEYATVKFDPDFWEEGEMDMSEEEEGEMDMSEEEEKECSPAMVTRNLAAPGYGNAYCTCTIN